MEHALRARLHAAAIDVDAVTVITGVLGKSDVPAGLAAHWAARWDGQYLADFAALTAAGRQDFLAREVDSFLQHPPHLTQRVMYAAGKAGDPDSRAAGGLAAALLDVVTVFGRDIRTRGVSPHTGKVKYGVLTDIDVGTRGAIVEVSTQHDAGGKVGQLAKLLAPAVNPGRLPVFHYFPNVDPLSRSVRALEVAGSAGVYNELATVVAAVRGLEEVGQLELPVRTITLYSVGLATEQRLAESLGHRFDAAWFPEHHRLSIETPEGVVYVDVAEGSAPSGATAGTGRLVLHVRPSEWYTGSGALADRVAGWVVRGCGFTRITEPRRRAVGYNLINRKRTKRRGAGSSKSPAAPFLRPLSTPA